MTIGNGFASVAAGYHHSVAMKPDGTIWAWGDNQYGQLGTGTVVRQNFPVQIAGGFAAIAILASR